jgi:hypothetical protein
MFMRVYIAYIEGTRAVYSAGVVNRSGTRDIVNLHDITRRKLRKKWHRPCPINIIVPEPITNKRSCGRWRRGKGREIVPGVDGVEVAARAAERADEARA